jgi:dTDP-4-dehydrorhamnose reductase
MKILLTGAAGQLGNELYPLLLEMGEVIAVDLECRNSPAPDCRQADLGNAERLDALLDEAAADLIVNAAAYTAVDRAEEEPETAFAVNAVMPGRIAAWARRNDSTVLHYSTDYVFDGESDRPYLESDRPAPLNVYGESKLQGEHAVTASGCRHFIIRTSWIYSAHGKNFVLSMLDLARRGLKLRVVNDQIGCPTWARSLARASQSLLKTRLHEQPGFRGRLFHYSDRDAVSWYDFADLVFATARGNGLLEQAPDLEPVPSSEYPQQAKRPAYSVLDCSLIRNDVGLAQVPLREALSACMAEVSQDAQ